MANSDAFNSGFDAGFNRKKTSKPQMGGSPKLGNTSLGGGKPTASPTMGSGAMSKGIMAGINRSSSDDKASPSTYKRGGHVKKTGMAKVHKGEVVVTASKAKTMKSSKKKESRKRVASKRG